MTKTEENLKAAFAGESQARNKYTYFAKVARKQGYHYVAKMFEETADNEKQHAKEEFKLLNGIGDTQANLKAAAEGEHYETSNMYPTFAKEAKEEGNDEAAKLFTAIGKVEAHHEGRPDLQEYAPVTSAAELEACIFGLGMPELIIVMVIILIIFGAGKLPEIGAGMGKAIKNFKDSTSEIENN